MSVLERLFPHEVTLAPAPAVGYIDRVGYTAAPSSTAMCNLVDAVPQGAYLHVSGWALDASRQRPAGAVLVSIDGSVFIEADFGTAREDVVQQYRSGGVLHCGFAAWVPTGRVAPGTHQILVVVLDHALETYSHLPVAEPITIVNAFIEFGIRTPRAAGTTVAMIDAIFDRKAGRPAQQRSAQRLICLGSDIIIDGWAVDLPAGRAAAGVYLSVNDREFIRAHYGLTRSDVAQHFEDNAFLNSGFTASLSSTLLGVGVHVLRLMIVSADGGSHYLLDVGEFSVVSPADFWDSGPH